MYSGDVPVCFRSPNFMAIYPTVVQTQLTPKNVNFLASEEAKISRIHSQGNAVYCAVCTKFCENPSNSCREYSGPD